MNKRYHSKRRYEILTKYPEIKSLSEPNFDSFFIILLCVFAQFALALYQSKYESLGILFILSYTIGSWIQHLCMILIHESCHNLVSAKLHINHACGILANLPLGIPVFFSFAHHHLNHHYHMNDTLDADVPLPLESRIFKGKLGKFLWLVFQPFFYTIRPAFVGKPVPVDSHLITNIFCILVADLLLFLYNPYALYYLLFCTYNTYSLHLFSVHTFYEHHQLDLKLKDETYSYYNQYYNLFLFNYGYHREHHDFPNVSWMYLPLVRKIAPEYYDDTLKIGIFEMLYKFIFDDKIQLSNRFALTS
jgi:sphingolipid delta-4 desaturase